MASEKAILLNRLIASLKTDGEAWQWYSDKDYLIHVSGLKLWVWSGSCHLSSPAIKFSFVGYLRLRSAFRTWRRVQGRAQWAQVELDRVRDALRRLA